MAEKTMSVKVKLDPEQMDYIKKTYFDAIDRVIQERQEIKAKMELAQGYLSRAVSLYSKVHPESMIGESIPRDDAIGIIQSDILNAMQIVKQVYDSIPAAKDGNN